MKWFNISIARIRALLGREGVIEEIDEEFRLHVDLETEANIARGMSTAEARRAALDVFGSTRLLREAAYDLRGGGMIETLIQDLKFAVRLLIKRPGFTAVAIITLGLGVGANTAMFSVINAVILQPLPFKDPGGLVMVRTIDRRSQRRQGPISYPNFLDVRSRTRSFDEMSVFRDSGFTLTGRKQAVHLSGEVVSANLFRLLGKAPALGRDFSPADDSYGHGLNAILSDRFWRAEFNADPAVVGQNIVLTNRSYTIIGVMPPGFQFPIQEEPVDLWVSIASDADPAANNPPFTSQRDLDYINAIGRLRPGVKTEQAQTEMSAIASRLESQYPDSNTGAGILLIPAFDYLVGGVRPALIVLLAAVGCVLLIACANVANLLLARAVTRQREMSVRAALGAGRARIIRQLLTESLLLSSVSGALGLAIAVWGVKAVVALSPGTIPRLAETRIDDRVLAFTILVSVATGIIFGLAPALHTSKMDLAESLKDGGRSGTEGGGGSRIRRLLVIGQVALGLVLLIAAGLLIQSFLRLQRVSPGFNPQSVLTFKLNLPQQRYSTDKQIDFFRNLLQGIRAVPGVKRASAVMPLPFSHDHIGITFEIEGRPVPKGQEPSAEFSAVCLDYFRTMQVPLIAGREFDLRDDRNSKPVVIINQTLAQRFFPNENPIGKLIKPDISTDERDPMMREIIGVVGDVKEINLAADADSQVYILDAQEPIGSMSLVVRTNSSPATIIAAARDQVRLLDPELPVYNVTSMSDYLSANIAQPRFSTLLLIVFAGLALILTAVGLYGVLAYSVEQRTHEIGIRIAQGATTVDVLRLVISQGMKLTLAGTVLGLVGALSLTRLMSSLLFGVSAMDPATFLTVPVGLAFVALAACYIPARRAARLDPMIALRGE